MLNQKKIFLSYSWNDKETVDKIDNGFKAIGIQLTRDIRDLHSYQSIPEYDLILTGRLVEVKRIDVFLQAIKIVADKIPQVKAVIIGNGKLLGNLQQIACNLGINSNVNFAGHKNEVERWLQKSKIFVLTSDSEGLSLSMMEAAWSSTPGRRPRWIWC